MMQGGGSSTTKGYDSYVDASVTRLNQQSFDAIEDADINSYKFCGIKGRKNWAGCFLSPNFAPPQSTNTFNTTRPTKLNPALYKPTINSYDDETEA